MLPLERSDKPIVGLSERRDLRGRARGVEALPTLTGPRNVVHERHEAPKGFEHGASHPHAAQAGEQKRQGAVGQKAPAQRRLDGPCRLGERLQEVEIDRPSLLVHAQRRGCDHEFLSAQAHGRSVIGSGPLRERGLQLGHAHRRERGHQTSREDERHLSLKHLAQLVDERPVQPIPERERADREAIEHDGEGGHLIPFLAHARDRDARHVERRPRVEGPAYPLPGREILERSWSVPLGDLRRQDAAPIVCHDE